MDTYMYLAIGGGFLGVVALLLLARKDIARKTAKFSIAGGLLGLVSELFYFRDYWRPPTMVGTARISPEDFLFGFAIAALALAIYPALSGQTFQDQSQSRWRSFSLMVVIGLVGMTTFNVWLGVNSIIVSSAIFIIFAAYMMVIRRDLVPIAIISAVSVMLVAIGLYVVLFDGIDPGYWDRHWLLAHTSLGIVVLGNIPLSEIVWYTSWGLLGGISYLFASGKGLAKPLNSRNSLDRASHL